MLRKTIISTLTAALVASGSVIGLSESATAAPSAPTSSARPAGQGDPTDYVANTNWLADAVKEGLALHGKAKLRKHRKLREHAPVPGPGRLHAVFKTATGAVIGITDVDYGNQPTTQGGEPGLQYEFALPAARKLLKKPKHPVVVVELTFQSSNPGVAAVTVVRSTRV